MKILGKYWYANISVIYSITYKNFSSIHIDESSCTGNIRILKCKCNYKKDGLKSKLVIHSLEADHIPNFDNSKIIKSNYNIWKSRIFLDGGTQK